MISARPAPRQVALRPEPSLERVRTDHSWGALLLLLAGIGVALLYVVVYPMREIHWASGWDTPFYVMWARRAQAFGLSASNTGTRPGTVGLLAALSSASHVSVAGVTAALAPALAACTGLGFAVFAETSVPAARHRMFLTAVLVGGFLSYMVLGYLATLVFLAALVCALACLAAGASRRRSPRSALAASALIGVAGLAHPTLVPLALVLVSAAAVAPLFERGRSLSASWPSWRPWFVRIVLVMTGSAALVSMGLLVARAAAGPVLDRARDGALRRLRLPGLEAGWRAALLAYLPYMIPSVLAALFAAVTIWSHRRSIARRGTAPRMFWGVLAAWVLTALGAAALLLAGFGAPGQRLAPVCLALPGVIAIAIALLNSDREWTRASRLVVAIPLVVGVVFTNWVLWQSHTGGPPGSVAAVRSLGPILAGEPPGTGLVVVADVRGDLPGIPVVWYANAVRAVVPPERVQDVHVFVGDPNDFLAGRPTLIGSQEHDRLALDYWKRMRPQVVRGSMAVVVQALDPRSYSKVARLPGHRLLAPGVLGLPGYTSTPPPTSGTSRPSLTSPGQGRFSPWLPVWLAPCLLLVMTGVGWPWATTILPERSATVRVAVAPGLGVAGVALASIGVDAAGLSLGGVGGTVAVVAPFLLGAGLAAVAQRRTNTSPSLSW